MERCGLLIQLQSKRLTPTSFGLFLNVLCACNLDRPSSVSLCECEPVHVLTRSYQKGCVQFVLRQPGSVITPNTLGHCPSAMGKRKSKTKAAKPPPARKDRAKFDCVVCRMPDSIYFPEFTKHKKTSLGLLVCRCCGLQVSFFSFISPLPTHCFATHTRIVTW